MKKIRVAFVAHKANLAGAARILSQIVKFIDKSKFEVIVIVDKFGTGLELVRRHAPVHYFHQQDFRVIQRGQQYQRRFWKYFQKYWYLNLLKTFQPDCIYFNTNGTPHLMQWSSAFACTKICHIHGHNEGLTYSKFLPNGLRTPVDKKELSTTLSVPHHFIACANVCRDTLTKELGVDPTSVTVIPENVDVKELLDNKSGLCRETLGWGKDEKIVGAVGQLSYRKGADIFIEAARLLKRRYRNRKLRFVWFGDDRNDVHPGESSYTSAFASSMKSLIIKYQLKSDVYLMGHYLNIHDYFKLFDVFVLPSRDEGIPLSLLEAMTFKIPTVNASVSGVPEALSQGSGILVEPDSAEALADGITQVLDNPQASHERVRVAFERVCSEFDSAKLIKWNEEVIKNVVEEYAIGRWS